MSTIHRNQTALTLDRNARHQDNVLRMKLPKNLTTISILKHGNKSLRPIKILNSVPVY